MIAGVEVPGHQPGLCHPEELLGNKISAENSKRNLLALDLPRLNSEWVEYHTTVLNDRYTV